MGAPTVGYRHHWRMQPRGRACTHTLVARAQRNTQRISRAAYLNSLHLDDRATEAAVWRQDAPVFTRYETVGCAYALVVAVGAALCFGWGQGAVS
jgi:hypothetical protein